MGIGIAINVGANEEIDIGSVRVFSGFDVLICQEPAIHIDDSQNTAFIMIHII